MKKWFSILLAGLVSLSLVACSNSGEEVVGGDTPELTGDIDKVALLDDPSAAAHALYLTAENGSLFVQDTDGNDVELLFNPILSEDWDALVEKAKGTSVNFYGWGGDEDLNNWLDNYYAPRMKDKYDITIVRVPMGAEDFMSQLAGEFQASPAKPDNQEDTSGTMDMIWINGENFKTARENNFLMADYNWKLPNLQSHMNLAAESLKADFGYPIKGQEVPYGEAQLILYNDSALTEEMPASAEEFKAFVQKYPGKVTYPALPDFTGSAFVRNIIYDIVGYEQFMTMAEDKATVKAAIQPALDYLVELNPYLWNEGKTFPSSSTQMENMFADKEIYFGMSYGAYSVAVNIENQKFSETTRSFMFDKGMIGNTNYIAIAKNAPNKIGALIAINEMISPEVQADRFAALRTLPVVDYNTLSDVQKQAFDAVDIGKGVIPQDELQAKKLPEMPAGLVPIIEEIWLEEVVGK